MGRADIYADEEEMERDLLRFDILPEILLHEDTIGVNNEFITEVVDFGFDDMLVKYIQIKIKKKKIYGFFFFCYCRDVIFPQEDDVTTISSIEEGLSPGRNNPGSYVFPNTLNTADVSRKRKPPFFFVICELYQKYNTWEKIGTFFNL